MHITCDNCQTKFLPDEKDSLVIQQGTGQPSAIFLAAALCPACTGPTAVLKLVVRRDEGGAFRYDGFQPVEAVAKAFGR